MSQAGAPWPAAAEVPPGGALEELDGSPIRRAEPAAPAIGWVPAFRVATGLAVGRPRLWSFALVAFLARGGLVVLALPMVVLPTFLGLANFVGPASVTAEGPGPRLVALVVAAAATALAATLMGFVAAAAAEVALHRATAAALGRAAAPWGAGAPGDELGLPAAPTVATGRAVARVALVRLVLVAPLAAALVAALPAWVAVAYRELTLPTDVAAPLLVRVLAGAPVATLAVAASWLATEVVGGFAARRAALLDASVVRALGAGLLDPLRAPLGTALVTVIGLVVAGGAVGAAAAMVGAAWGLARDTLAAPAAAPVALGVAILLAAAWLAALVVAAFAAAWRATMVTAELLRRRPGARRAGARPA